MRQHCNNPRNSKFPIYGGRGIKVCIEGEQSFPAFLAHVGLRPSKEYSIDRINGSKGYEPGNVKWSTASEQNKNRPTYNVTILWEGQEFLLVEVCRYLGFPAKVARQRRAKGWKDEELFIPLGSMRSKYI